MQNGLTVLDLFARRLESLVISKAVEKILKGVPLSSPKGIECSEVISAAESFLNAVRKTGIDPPRFEDLEGLENILTRILLRIIERP